MRKAGPTLGVVAVTAAAALAAREPDFYEVTGRFDPPAVGLVELHGATAPFHAVAQAGSDGKFRFRRIPRGSYTISGLAAGFVEARRTIEVGPGTAAKRRVSVTLPLQEGPGRQEIQRRATVTARALAVPDKARREYELAQRMVSRQNAPAAIAHLQRAVAIAPGFAAAWNFLGTIAYQTARGQETASSRSDPALRGFSQAEEYFRKALEAEPDSYEPLVNLGGVLLNLGRPAEALDLNRAAVARRPGDALAHSQLGLTYFLLKDAARARTHLEEARRLDPAHFSHPQLILAEIYLASGDIAEGIRVWEEFIHYHPDDPRSARIRQEIHKLSNK